jgi:hypothetical protein
MGADLSTAILDGREVGTMERRWGEGAGRTGERAVSVLASGMSACIR